MNSFFVTLICLDRIGWAMLENPFFFNGSRTTMAETVQDLSFVIMQKVDEIFYSLILWPLLRLKTKVHMTKVLHVY